MISIPKLFSRVVMGVVAITAIVMPVDQIRAHAQLDRTSPVASSVVPNSPSEILLDFSEPVDIALGSIRLFDRSNQEIPLGDLRHQVGDKSIIVADVPQLASGPYAVVWKATSTDGHVLNGAFSFEVGNQSSGEAAQLLETVITTIDNSSPLEPWINVLRYLSFLSIVVLIGVVVLTAASELLNEQRLMALLSISLATLFVSTIGHFLLHGPYLVGGSWSDIGDLDVLAKVIDTRVGLALLLRIALLVLATVLALGIPRRWNESPLWTNTAMLISIGLVLSFGLAGHPSTASPAALAVVVDGLHLWSLSVWIGGIITLALAWKVLVRVDAQVHDIHVVNRFSRLATVAMPATAISGLVSAVIITGGITSVFENRYGQILLLKIVVVAVIVVIGALARRVLRKTGAFAIRRAILLEAVLALAVFAFSVGLVVTPPDGVDTSATSVHSATLVQDDVVVDMTISPTRVGPAEVHVILSPPQGSLDPMQNVALSLTSMSDSDNVVAVDMIEVGPNHWSGFVEIPSGGQWQATADVTRNDGTMLRYQTEVKVSS